jgi:hypothetical protein
MKDKHGTEQVITYQETDKDNRDNKKRTAKY